MFITELKPVPDWKKLSPLVPELPDVPDEPLVPLLPDVPATPLVPLLPDVPATPLVPDVPELPEVPELPDVPDEPLVPDDPDVPELPLVPDVPDVPALPIQVSRRTLKVVVSPLLFITIYEEAGFPVYSGNCEIFKSAIIKLYYCCSYSKPLLFSSFIIFPLSNNM
jgi:hypothetical protein